jgi:uncharacterized protein YfeS
MPVDIAITFQTDSSYGGSPLWNPLEQATETLDCDVRALSVHVLAPGTVPGRFPGLGGVAGAAAIRLPRCRWSPKTGHLRLEYVTRHDAMPDPSAGGGISPSVFRAQVGELADQLKAQASGPRPKPGLDIGALVACLRALEARVPETQPEFSAFLSDAYHAGEARRARLPWWEQLDVRWEDWHPVARQRLDDRLFWEQEAAAAPHGNDTGADLLRAYRRRRSRAAGGAAFLDRLLRRWQIPTDWRVRPPEQWTADDETWIVTWDEAAIALAFAQIKLEGDCEADVRALALEAIDREAGAAAAARFGWSPRPERDAALLRMRHALVTPET